MKLINRFLMLFVAFLMFVLLENVNVKATYSDVCDGEQIKASSGTYTRCDNKNIYLMMNDINKSSYIVANRDVEIKNQLLYAGKIDGLDTFYSLAFNYYSVIYDNRNLFNSNDNVYSDISINGEVVYSGKFEDNILIDESKSFFVKAFYDEKGTYLIRQYIGNKVYSAIRVIVVDDKDLNITVSNAKYGTELLGENDLIYDSSNNLSFAVNGGQYGFGNYVNVKINECSKSVVFNKNLIITSEVINGCLKQNDNNTVSLTILNGLGEEKKYDYKFYLYGANVSIKLEDSVSDVITTSRRIVVKASPGLGNSLDEEACLYYWSTNANDKLTYEDFMTNYELSENKGRYTSNKGVILRDSYGTFYLYALAKDNENSIVVRSNEYILKKNTRINNTNLSDLLFVLGVSVCAVVPIVVYLFVRGKDTYLLKY